MQGIIECCKNTCLEHINEGGGKITGPVISGFNWPDNIKNLIKQDYKMFFSIVDFYIGDFKIVASRCGNLIDALKLLEFIKIKDDERTKYVDQFNQVIFPWLKSSSIFIEIYEEVSPIIIKPSDLIPITKFNKDDEKPLNLRDNQKEAFDRLEKNGLETGIHCQATGCGKSYIIIRYIDYTFRKITNPKIILFTERVNILSDLFSFKRGDVQADMEKLLYWKNKGIGDLTKFNIINRVTIKKKDWDKLLIDSKGPTLLVINRAFLTLGKKYKSFQKHNLDLVLHDECHNTSSSQCHEFLVKCKSLGVPVVGFSATPLRTGKDDKPKLLEIYGNKDNELELLTNYNMIYAISKNLILAPEFYWYQIESYNKEKSEDKNNELVSQQELGSVLELLNHLVPLLPNKKLIGWCGTINLAKKWKAMIESSYKQRKNLINFTFGLDTSETITEDYEYFSKIPKTDDKTDDEKILTLDKLGISDKRRMYWGNSILFCANKHREGSDIGLLDACIFLDKVKDRGSIPFIQSIGRVLRLCPNTPNKLKGVVIDGFVKDVNNYERQFVDKIIGYYMALENLTGLNESEGKTKYEQYVEMRDIVQFDKDKEIIKMKLGGNIIKIHCNKLEWDEIVGKFDKILQDKIKLSVEDNFKHKALILKEVFGFGPNTNFIKAYKAISPEDKAKYNLPDIESDEYSKLLNNKSWVEFLEIEHDFYSLEELIIQIKKTRQIFGKKNWKKLNKLNSRIPKYPEYYYKNFSYQIFEKISKNSLVNM